MEINPTKKANNFVKSLEASDSEQEQEVAGEVAPAMVSAQPVQVNKPVESEAAICDPIPSKPKKVMTEKQKAALDAGRKKRHEAYFARTLEKAKKLIGGHNQMESDKSVPTKDPVPAPPVSETAPAKAPVVPVPEEKPKKDKAKKEKEKPKKSKPKEKVESSSEDDSEMDVDESEPDSESESEEESESSEEEEKPIKRKRKSVKDYGKGKEKKKSKTDKKKEQAAPRRMYIQYV